MAPLSDGGVRSWPTGMCRVWAVRRAWPRSVTPSRSDTAHGRTAAVPTRRSSTGNTPWVDESVDAEEVRLLEGVEPNVPRRPLAPDEDVAVAVWRDEPVGAIMSIWNDPEDEQQPLHQFVTIFERLDAGWTRRGTGSDAWPFEYGERPPNPRPILIGTGAGPLRHGRLFIWLASGIAPPGVTRVRVELPRFETEVQVEPVTGAFLVAIPDWTPDSNDPEPTISGIAESDSC